MADNKYYFRDKRLARRQKIHQKFLLPFARWVVSLDPKQILSTGLLLFGGWNLFRLFVVNFYWTAVALPWLILTLALLLSGLSYALRKEPNE